MQAGLVFNIQRYCFDGTGTRTLVLLKGCPLSCGWCRTPECRAAAREIVVVEARCIQCGKCVLACPVGGTGQTLPKDVEGCLSCGKCTEVCPSGARRIIGQRMTVSEVMAKIQEDRAFLKDSFSGVTFAGGEPLFQPVFLCALLQACREQGIHTIVDTCGYGSTDRLLAIAPLVDVFLWSLRFIDDSSHRRHCGVSNALILENLTLLDAVHQRIWVRVPIVPGVTDSEENLRQIAGFVSKLRHVTWVQFLPHRRIDGQRYEELGEGDPLADKSDLSVLGVEMAVRVFRNYGLDARLRG